MNTSVKTLWLARGKIEDAEAQHISDMLKVNRTLRCLELYDCAISRRLDDCGISPVGFSYLSEGLAENDTLRVLNLQFSSVSDEHVEELCPGLAANTSLERLVLGSFYSASKISEKGVGYLVQALDRNMTLKQIELPPAQDGDVPSRTDIDYYLELTKLNRKLIRDENAPKPTGQSLWSIVPMPTIWMPFTFFCATASRNS